MGPRKREPCNAEGTERMLPGTSCKDLRQGERKVAVMHNGISRQPQPAHIFVPSNALPKDDPLDYIPVPTLLSLIQ